MRPRASQHGRRLGQAPGHPDATEQPGGDVGRTGREQLLVGVDPVATPAGEQPGGAQPLRKTHQRQGRTRAKQRDQVAGLDRRQPGRRQPARDRADDLDAPRLQVQRRRGGQATDKHHQPPRQPRGQPLAAEQDEQRDRRHDHRRQIGVAARQARAQGTHPLHDLTLRRRHPEQVGYLTEDDEDGQAQHEAGDDRLGQELRHPSDPKEAGGEQDQPGAQRQRGCVGRRLRRPRNPEAGEKRPRQHRHRRHRPHDELTRRAEDRVRHQSHRHRIQAHLDRGAGDRGVAERLRNRERRHHGARDDIAAQPAPLVPRQPRHRRHPPPATPRRCPCPITHAGPPAPPSNRQATDRKPRQGHPRQTKRSPPTRAPATLQRWASDRAQAGHGRPATPATAPPGRARTRCRYASGPSRTTPSAPSSRRLPRTTYSRIVVGVALCPRGCIRRGTRVTRVTWLGD